jgi:molecular chaperone GrpE (heat shock protein)
MIDIFDAIERTDNRDIKTVYENLLEGSKSHLRAFVKALETQGIVYEPRFIDEDLYNEIISE